MVFYYISRIEVSTQA